MIEYTFIKSKRRTIGITVKPDGSVILRAPNSCSKKRAEEFLLRNLDWVEKARARMLAKTQKELPEPFTEEELREIRQRAKSILPAMTKEIAGEIGVGFRAVHVRLQKSRWGSCSEQGNINLNGLLVLLPESVMRYVVVHELCHRRQMNHSNAFWAEVAKYQPTFRADRKYLRDQGAELLERLRESGEKKTS